MKLRDSLRLTQENHTQHSSGPMHDITGNVTESISRLDLKSKESSEVCLGTISERTEIDAHSEPIVINVNVVNRKNPVIDAHDRARSEKSPGKEESIKTTKTHAKDTKRETAKSPTKDTTKEMFKTSSKVQRKSPRCFKEKSGFIPSSHPSKEGSKHAPTEAKVRDKWKSTSSINCKRSSNCRGSPKMPSKESAKSLMKEVPECLGETLDSTKIRRDELGSIVGNLINELTVEVAKEVSSELSKKAFGSRTYKPVKYFPPRRGVIVNNASKNKSAKSARKPSLPNASPEGASNTTLFDAVIASGIEGTAHPNSTKSFTVRLKSNSEKTDSTPKRLIQNRSPYVTKEQSGPRIGKVTGKQPAASVIQANQPNCSAASKNWIPGSAIIGNYLEKNSKNCTPFSMEEDNSAVAASESLSDTEPDINIPVPNGKMINVAKKALANSGSLKISASCNHLQFKCIDEIQVYMAQNKSNNAHSSKANALGGRTCRAKDPYNYIKPIEKPIPHHQVLPGRCCKYCHQPPKVATTCIQADLVDRREEILKRCALQTLPGISIDSTCSCTEEGTVNPDSNCCCTNDYGENGNQTSGNSITSDFEGGPRLSERLTKISFQEEKEEHVSYDGLFGCNENLKIPAQKGEEDVRQIVTVTRAISPIIFMCQDACIQNKPSQQDHSIATVLVADIPSTRPPEVPCSTNNDDTIYTILCQRRMDSNSESCADNQSCHCYMNSSKSGTAKNTGTDGAGKIKSCACINQSDRRVDALSPQRAKKVSILEAVEMKECLPSLTCDSCQKLENSTESKMPGCCGGKPNSHDEEKKTRDREKLQRDRMKQAEREREQVKASKKQQGNEMILNSTLTDRKCECFTTCDRSARPPCTADCSFNKGTICVKETRQTETPEKSGCCQCCQCCKCCKKKKKKYCTSETCTSDICRISEMPEKSSETSSECTNKNCISMRDDSRTRQSPLYRSRATKSEDISKSYRVAHCIHDNKNQLHEEGTLQASMKVRASTSENYITVHDVSAQAEAVELDNFNLSCTSLMAMGSPKRTASLDDFLNMLECPSPQAPKKIGVNPFPAELLDKNKKSGRPHAIVDTCTSPIKFSDKTRVDSLPKGNCNKIQSFLKSRNEILSKTKYFDWKLMRRKKDKPTSDSRPGNDFLKSFRHPFDSQTSSEGEIDCQCSVSIGEIHQCEKNK